MGRAVSVVLVDVNNLTAVNREYGVRAGDAVLRHVARTIEATKRYNDVVARLGDDEFGVLLMETGEEGHPGVRRAARGPPGTRIGGHRGRTAGMSRCGRASARAASTATPEITHAEALLEAAMADLNQAKQDRERRRRMWLSA